MQALRPASARLLTRLAEASASRQVVVVGWGMREARHPPYLVLTSEDGAGRSIDDILVGVVHDFDTGPTFVALALTLMAIPSLMVLLSTTLPARVNRATNLVVATLYIPASVYDADGESWSYSYFYGLSIGLEVLLLAFILRAAWTWPRSSRATAGRDLVQARV